MSGDERIRIAAFATDFPIALQGWLCELIDGLAARGVDVDLFLYGSGSHPELGTGIRVIDLSDPAIVAAAGRVPGGPPGGESAWAPMVEPFVPGHAMRIVPALAASERYAYCVAFEARALLMARLAADAAGCPLMLHSFELYEPAWPGVWKEQCGALRALEGRMLPGVDLLIIQDEGRLAEYYRITGGRTRPREVMFVPVALPAVGDPSVRDAAKPRYWHARFGLPAETRIVLYVGQVGQGRFVEEMVRAAQRFGADRRLVLHGIAYDRDYLARLQQADVAGRVLFSQELTSHRRLGALCASADVGLVFYRDDRPNDYHTGRSSDKLARYLQAGLPVVCSDLPSFRREVERYGFGRCCGSWDRLTEEVEAILGDYGRYQAGARRAFEAVYRLGPYVDRLAEWIRAGAVRRSGGAVVGGGVVRGSAEAGGSDRGPTIITGRRGVGTGGWRLRNGYDRIYHYHIRKTGGTSVNYMFLSLGGEAGPAVYDRINADTTRPVVSGDKIFAGWDQGLIERGDYFYAFSHTPAYRLRLPPGTFTLTCLRDPVERVLSYYRMLLYHRVNNIPHPGMVHELPYLGASFSDFLTRVPASLLLNQLYMFSEVFDVEEAVWRITRCSQWLLLEDFEAGVERLNERLGLTLEPMHVRKARIAFEPEPADRRRLEAMVEPERRLLERLRRVRRSRSSRVGVVSSVPTRAEPQPELSIIVTVHQKERHIGLVIDGIVRNTTSPFELVVVYDGCTDRSEAVVNAVLSQGRGMMRRLTVVHTPDVNEVRANNAGMRAAGGRYLILVQDDMQVLERGWERRLLHPMRRWDDVFAVSSGKAHSFSCTPPPRQGVNYTCTVAAERDVFRIRDAVNRGPLALRADVMRRLGYLDEAYAPIYFDDMDLCVRAYQQLGYKAGVYKITFRNLPATVGGNKHAKLSTGGTWLDSANKNRVLFWRRYQAYFRTGVNHDEDRPCVFDPALEGGGTIGGRVRDGRADAGRRGRIAAVSRATPSGPVGAIEGPAGHGIVCVDRLRMERVGSEDGGWVVDLRLIPRGSLVISVGVGEDIAFERGLIEARGCRVIGIDPGPRAAGCVQGFSDRRFHLMRRALAAHGGLRVRMYEDAGVNHTSDHVSHPVWDNVSGPEVGLDRAMGAHRAVDVGRFYEAETVGLTELLAAYPDAAVLKLDIEGAEYEVLRSVAALRVPQVCVAFHHGCAGYTLEDTLECVERMRRMGYLVGHREDKAGPWHEVTFVHSRCLRRPGRVHGRHGVAGHDVVGVRG